MRVLALVSSWPHLAVWAAAGVGAVAAATVVTTLLRGKFSPPPGEAVLVIAVICSVSYVDVDFGRGVATVLGACALGYGGFQYVRGYLLESRAKARARQHTTAAEWAAHFAMNGTCPCADESVKRPGERGGVPAALTGCPTSPLEPRESASRSGRARGVDAGRPEDTRPVTADERQARPTSPVAALAVARHHVSVSDSAVAPRLGGDVVPHPRLTSAEPALGAVKSPAFHVNGSAALAEAG